MNTVKYFVLSLFIYVAVAPLRTTAQSVSGKWYGVGYVDVPEATNNYLCELLLTQSGNTVTGEFNYYFRNGYFSNKVKGTFKLDSRYLNLSLVPVMYNHTVNTLVGVDCPMHGEFSLRISRTETALTGNFLSDDLHKYTCAPLKINFKLQPKEEPTLKERIEHVAKEDTLEEEAVPMPQKRDTTQHEVVKTLTPPQPSTAAPTTIQAVITPVAIDKKIEEDAKNKLRMRSNNLVRTLDVTDDSVRIDLYDNAELDYDTVTVFYNQKVVQYKRMLDTRQPIRFYVHVDSIAANNDLVMYAENLGLIPPNSAIMIITDGEHRYEISLTSDYQRNAAVRLKKGYKPVLQTNQ